MSTVNVRNLEQIRETEPGRSSWNLAALVLAAVGGAALLGTAAIAWQTREAPPEPLIDPLAELARDARGPGAVGTESEIRFVSGSDKPTATAATAAAVVRVSPEEATFAEILSDKKTPTTAYVAVPRSAHASEAVRAQKSTAPPRGLDRLAVVPLPIGDLVNATAASSRPKDALTQSAARVSTPAKERVAPGASGKYQLQVAAFQSLADAKRLASNLRKREHRAHVEEAAVNGATWYRVRIGPFASRQEASAYRAEFAEAERMRPFIVDPNNTKRRAAEESAKAQIKVRG